MIKREIFWVITSSLSLLLEEQLEEEDEEEEEEEEEEDEEMVAWLLITVGKCLGLLKSFEEELFWAPLLIGGAREVEDSVSLGDTLPTPSLEATPFPSSPTLDIPVVVVSSRASSSCCQPAILASSLTCSTRSPVTTRSPSLLRWYLKGPTTSLLSRTRGTLNLVRVARLAKGST